MNKLLSLIVVLIALSGCAQMEAHKKMDDSRWLERKHMRNIK